MPRQEKFLEIPSAVYAAFSYECFQVTFSGRSLCAQLALLNFECDARRAMPMAQLMFRCANRKRHSRTGQGAFENI
jgi:hypothetical protein